MIWKWQKEPKIGTKVIVKNTDGKLTEGEIIDVPSHTLFSHELYSVQLVTGERFLFRKDQMNIKKEKAKR
ncbi:hypothetical protein PP175_27985 (plasmid) [Aneurinibacillus sp. Ricciae_BoGa-3]|uniref:hypothetical protein n=1 Tax=Aneurinibacillus sp. Ricciae_BoGa-3 TaxID=3022697 RepID=UPI0023426324|nr:hypothetical protein [Aneurinibacillus sp. Ricciae_BoGa-3]WCK57032.1 hypothetical protein PP175_27985 [Aneurinibacillus sp. Ricciae_BoGa-3]